eukprot:TRINITY_DN605_c0_g1_i7.p1 TRINITY_DN605_c0_g1~~TRINITY_DN605_c0_g1_i7.p1  ORF type:complete len:175 (-),score=11.92 TRINITY_DN605_c0_g1_i7:69-593(-)
MRSDDGSIAFSLYLKLSLALVLLYALLATILFGLASARDESSPLFAITDHISAIQILYYISSAIYIAIIIIFFGTLVISIQPINERPQFRTRFIFFSGPTMLVIMSVLVGLFLGTIGPFGRDAPSFVFYLVMYNLYVYTLLWGYWPIEISFGVGNPSEGSRVFSPPKEYEPLNK